jgi:hypothetical protein
MNEALILLRKVGLALLRLACLALFMLVHHYLNAALSLVIPSNMTEYLEVAQTVIGILFLLVYVYLTWDMVTVFMPWLKRYEERMRDAAVIEKKESHESGE